MRISIVGLPFSGKSTLFQAITRTRTDPSAAAQTDVHRIMINVPDSRLSTLSSIFSPRSTTYATIELMDIVGLMRGDSSATGFSSELLSGARTSDALLHVARAFVNESVPHAAGDVGILRDIATLEAEIILSDLMIIERRIEKVTKQLQKFRDENMNAELVLLRKCAGILENGEPMRDAVFTLNELHLLRGYQLLSMKPMLIALNFDEVQQAVAEDEKKRVTEAKGGRNTRVVSFFGRIDREVSELPEDEAATFRGEYGLKESALDTLIREAYALLGLRSFFTVGEDECRAWTIREGMTAQEAAGVIHSTFVGKFIRAEVVHYDDFIALGGSMTKAREAGLWRLEGKSYLVKDGDIMSVRHS